MFAIEVAKEAGRTFIRLPATSRRYVAAVGFGIVIASGVVMWFLVGLFRVGTPSLCGTSGRVTYQGNPIAIGQIAFEPRDSRYGAGSAVPIRDGTFVLPAAIGLRPSLNYRLLVTAYRLASDNPILVNPSGQTHTSSTLHHASEEYVQFIPSKYNVDSDLSFEATIQRLHKGVILDLQ